MKKLLLLLIIPFLSFGQENIEPKITGIGGVFFKSENPIELKNWYTKNLGINTDEYGYMFLSRNIDHPEKINYLQWSPFNKNTNYFNPSTKDFMINYTVQNIEGLVENLKKDGVMVVDTIEEYEYGKFVHILDSEGNKIELWEPPRNQDSINFGE